MMLQAIVQALGKGVRSLRGQRGKAPDTTPQAEVNLTAYLGRWYEQARYDCFFEHGLDDVYADYARRADGRIDITNVGFDVRGREHRAEGRAVIPLPEEPGRLWVSFVPPYCWFRAPYHILYTDAECTEALVSGDGRRYLWLLTRDRKADDATMRRLLSEATRRGFDLGPLRLTRQKRKSAPAEI